MYPHPFDQHQGADMGLQTGYPASSDYPPAPNPGYATPGHGIHVHFHVAAPSYHAPVAPQYPSAHAPVQFPQPDPQAPDAEVNINHFHQYQETPTIKEKAFDAISDAQILRKAMKGLGTDEAAIINILAKRTNEQRQRIAQSFKSTCNRDLIKDLKSELSGRFEDTILAMMTPKWDFLAMKLHKAISGIGTREKTLVDILCTGTNEEIREVNDTYQKMFHKSLESDIIGDTSGHFKKLYIKPVKRK